MTETAPSPPIITLPALAEPPASPAARAAHAALTATQTEPQANGAGEDRIKILVLHGPNLNLLGRREPHIYGTTTLGQIDERITALASELDVEVEIFQSNHEGALLDRMQARMDHVQGCVFNPAALTHTSVALHDCIKAMPFPVVEVHLSNLQAREAWRQRSITGEASRAAVMGFGWRSYTAALRVLVEQLREERGAR